MIDLLSAHERNDIREHLGGTNAELVSRLLDTCDALEGALRPFAQSKKWAAQTDDTFSVSVTYSEISRARELVGE